MTTPQSEDRPGPIRWMARNPVAANLLMFVILLGGLLSTLGLKQEVFPAFDLDLISVSVPYPGASPVEVEQGIILAVEEAVIGVEGVKRVTSVAREGSGSVSVELLLGADTDRVLADVTNAVDRITSFPGEAERPTIAAAGRRQPVISLILSGDQDLETLQPLAESARTELLGLGGITQVDVSGVRPLEFSIEVRREQLEAYDLTLEEIAQQIRQASVDLPGGEIETAGGEVLVRVADRRKRSEGFEDIVVRAEPNGADLRVGDIAVVHDGFQDTDQSLFYNGQPAVQLIVSRVGNQTPTAIANTVNAYAEELAVRVPEQISVSTWNDDSETLRARIDLLFRNAALGLVLVLVLLGLFLNHGLAAWVALGIPISFLGAFLGMVPADLSINVITLFALIVTLGLVVDDAIVVGENVHAYRSKGMDPMTASIRGAREMVVPVTFSVLTTMIAFAPLLFVPGVTGKIFRLIPLVVIAVLFFSLIESFFILPAHLAHRKEGKSGRFDRLFGPIDRVQARVSGWLADFTEHRYIPALKRAVNARYVTLAVATAFLILTVGTVGAGYVPFNFFPPIPGDVVSASARLPYGTNIANTRAVQAELERGLEAAVEQAGGSEVIRGVMTRLGSASGGQSAQSQGSHLVSVEVALIPSGERDFDAVDFESWWRGALPPLPGVEVVKISGTSTQGPSAGSAVSVQLSHSDNEQLAEASQVLASSLREFPSLVNVDNSYTDGKPQLDFRLRDEARAWGLTSSDVARAIRSSFFGAEALREQRGRNEIKVMVRLPEEQRSSENDLEQLLVGLPQGGTVPLAYVADVTRGRSPTEITREEGRRTVTVAGELAPGASSSRPVIASLSQRVFPELREQFPGLEMRFSGQQQELNESLSSLGPMYLVALLLMFSMIAIPFGSYLQPFVVMATVPFGIVGAVLGHLIMGYELSMVSGFGIIALSGIVVNDSLVLVDSVNRFREEGMELFAAVVAGSARRLRPILLTSLTTFFGLAPMILEQSSAARFLVPMAISLGFGALFVTVIALLVVPSLYMILEDLKAWAGNAEPAGGLPSEGPVAVGAD
ncbi:MAG: efflux RND transporter permease subunit [Gemmatimonadetes bacterium]|nr:efflux RND transporter permease subunit [Gemmatimonadota bacterium]MDA1103168.1 efflux RND transporter permease subunit [Gemmatimonadota bacterium]